ncbi:MAG: FtsX-like permease family protein [Acidobacteria bacterium]|nr:MAG: FtsX-like permease family protein [Acidobacteriota bacterium]
MLTRDVRHAFRLFYKQPFFSGAAVFVMALGIGASVVMFTVVDAVLLRPLPFPDANRLVAIEETSEGRPSSVSPVNFYDWERQAQSFSSMAIFAEANMTLATGGEAIAVAGIAVSSRFFSTLGVQMALGRHFSPEDDRAGGPLSVVLSHGLWLRAFGGRHDVVGQQVAFDGFPYTVIGIAPRGVAYPEGAEAWFSLALSDRSLAPTARGAHWVEAIGRLEPGTKIEAAQAEMNRIAANLAAAYPRTNRSSGAKVVDLLESMTGSARPALLLLFGSVGCLLTIACVNVSGLLMVRAAGRRTEAAIRAALGAGRMALVRQVMTESIVLASVAGGIGITMASWGQNLLLALLPSDLPRASAIGLDLRAVLFAMAVALLAGFALGVLPACTPFASRARARSKPRGTTAERLEARGCAAPSWRRRLRLPSSCWLAPASRRGASCCSPRSLPGSIRAAC